MMSIGRVAEYSAMTNATAPKSSEELAEKKPTTMASDNNDKFVRSQVTFAPSYTRATVTENNTNASSDNEAADKQKYDRPEKKAEKGIKGLGVGAKSVVQGKNELMQDMVRRMLTGQAEYSKKTSPMNELAQIISGYAEEAEKTANGDETYWSVESTANRILDFAKSLAGDDVTKLEELRKAFEKGFSQSESIFGGKNKLPSISYETYDKVQKGFDDWASEIKNASENAAPAAQE